MKKFITVLPLCCMLFNLNSMESEKLRTPPNQEILQAKHTSPRIICDPTYDTTFKQLFGNDGEEADGVTSKERLKDFLNGILNLGIVQIEYLPTVKDADIFLKTVIFDILCRCECKEHEGTAVVDIEIQRSRKDFCIERTILYNAKNLVSESSKGTSYVNISQSIVIAILDCQLKGHESTPVFAGRWVKTPIHERDRVIPYEILSRKMEAYYFQLPLVAEELKRDENPVVSSTGKAWLTLLSSKYIQAPGASDDAIAFNDGEYNSLAITSATTILENFRTGDKYARFRAEQDLRIESERVRLSLDEEAKEQGREEGIRQGREEATITRKFKKFKKSRDENTEYKVHVSLKSTSSDMIKKTLLSKEKSLSDTKKRKVSDFVQAVVNAQKMQSFIDRDSDDDTSSEDQIQVS